jgi:hypothetical protein
MSLDTVATRRDHVFASSWDAALHPHLRSVRSSRESDRIALYATMHTPARTRAHAHTRAHTIQLWPAATRLCRVRVLQTVSTAASTCRSEGAAARSPSAKEAQWLGTGKR